VECKLYLTTRREFLCGHLGNFIAAVGAVLIEPDMGPIDHAEIKAWFLPARWLRRINKKASGKRQDQIAIKASCRVIPR